MCDRSADARARNFYERQGWFAVLAVPPHIRGHAVLARSAQGQCPSGVTAETVRGLDVAIADVTGLLRRYYAETTNIFIVSLRAKDPHVHLHLIPAWPGHIAAWRAETGHTDGYMFAYLGDLEVATQRQIREFQDAGGLTETAAVRQLAPDMETDCAALANLAARL